MKGIILAGGHGTRLYPLTIGVSKQLLPVYDKPMIYYPLSVLMLSGIREILIISTQSHLKHFKDLFKDGSQYGISISYAAQDRPRGIADAFILGKKFIGNDTVSLILGDNIFHGNGLSGMIKDSIKNINNATIFGYKVDNPKRYGVVSFDKSGNPHSIDEKPIIPKSNYAVVGLYLYPNDVINLAENLNPSKRGELEITDINQEYLKQNRLQVKKLGRGFSWYDAGTHDALLEAGQYIRTIEKRNGYKVACLEEIAYEKGWIDLPQLHSQALIYKTSNYGKYLETIINEES